MTEYLIVYKVKGMCNYISMPYTSTYVQNFGHLGK